MKNNLINDFKEVFKIDSNIRTFFSPGRVNLIGEHIDYNGGFVMPAALSYGTYGAVSFRDDMEVHLFSNGFSEKPLVFNINDITKDNNWADYVKGVFDNLLKRGFKINKGLNILINSTMPTNAGLSSSSSLELLIIVILNNLFNLELDKTTMAIIGKEVENKYIGVNSGIMDQFSIIHGKENNAILLNTENLEYKYVPIKLDGYSLVIANTNKKRGLADSKYNERFNETKESLKILQKTFDVEDLCSLKSTDLEKIESILNNETLFKRTRHVITEQERTILSMEYLSNNQIDKFAKILIESHNSLRDDYNVTGLELDMLVKFFLENGATGARMTGAGFGGCVVGIVPNELVESLTLKVINSYKKVIGYEPSFYDVLISDGTKEI